MKQKENKSVSLFIIVIIIALLMILISVAIRSVFGVVVGLAFFIIAISGIISRKGADISKSSISYTDSYSEGTTAKSNVSKNSANTGMGTNANVLQYKTEKFHVAGTSHYQKDIESLGSENYDFELSKKELIDQGFEDEKIYLYEFSPTKVELIEEPDNPYDPNAIKVVIDNVLVGYIKKGSCSHIKKLLHSGKIKKIDANIYGGKYKMLYSEYDDEKDKEVYYIEKDRSDYHVTIQISVEE